MKTLWSGTVPADATDIIAARIERVAKRAERKGFPVPTAVYGKRTSVTSDDGVTTVEWVDLEIVAEGSLRLGDFEFVGTISALEDGSPFVTYAPGVERVDDTFATVNYCDHCQATRYRNDTYIVRSEDGVTKQVGSTCIKDFTGHDPSAIVAWLSAIDSLSFNEDEVSSWGRSATRFYPPKTIIEIAARIVAKAGYISKQKAWDDNRAATAELVRVWLSATPHQMDRLVEDFPEDPESIALFLNTMAAIEAKADDPAPSDWLADIIRLSAATGVQWRHVGILGSSVILGMREQEREVTEGRPASNFIGDVGQRLTFTDVTVNLKRGYENAYGFSYVIKMSVNGSDDLLWFTSASTKGVEDLSEGDVINLVATIKGHEMDQRSHRETTVLTRGSIKE